MALYTDIFLDQGSSYSGKIPVKNKEGFAIDLSGYAARGQIRKHYSSNLATDFNAVIEESASGEVFVAIALFFFAFTTLLAYYYIAETNVAYIRRSIRFPGELTILKIVLMASVFYGTVRSADLAWALGDIGVGLMAWLNIIGILILFFMGSPAIKALKDYEQQKDAGVEKYTFDPEALGIRNADFWK